MNTCTFTVILPSVSHALDNMNLELTQSNFFPSDHLYMFHLFLNNHVNSLSVTGVQIQCPFLQALLLIIPFSKYQSISLAQGLKVVCMILAFPPSIWLFSYFWLLRQPTTQTRNNLNFFWTSLNWRFVLLGVDCILLQYLESFEFNPFRTLFFLCPICSCVIP